MESNFERGPAFKNELNIYPGKGKASGQPVNRNPITG